MKIVKLTILLSIAILFSCFATPSMAVDEQPTTRIVGGNNADPGEYPFVVSLQDSMGHFCGASIISPTYVMTAAHCSGGTIDAVIGLYKQNDTGNTQKIRVKKQINHPQYNGAGNDIAVYELSEPIDPSLYSPVKLASSSDSTAGTMTTAIGWGRLSDGGSTPNTLQEVNVPIVSYSTCDNAYAKEGESIDKNSEICAGYSQGGKDSCQGDSGGPLVINKNGEFYQVGVVSWGIGCAEPNLYGVYAYVANLASWVENTVPDLGDGSGGGGGGGGDDCYTSNVTLNLTTDNYGSETSWNLKNSSGATLYSGSGYNNNSNITKTFVLPAGNYVFTINDSYGDGLTEGNGSYRLTDGAGKQIVAGRDFGKTEATNFCITAGGGGGGGDDCFSSNVTLNLTTDNYGDETSWNLKNSSGSTLYSGSGYSDNSNITKTFVLPAGNYVFTINDSYGDGLTEGNGSYKLTDGAGKQIVAGRDFGKTESTNFCISGGDSGGGGGGDADVITITKALYRADKSKLTVLATSSAGNNVTLTVVGYGDMTWNATKGAYIYRKRSVADPGNSITVKSSGGGQATKSVKH